MNRRGFFGRLAGAVVGVVVAPAALIIKRPKLTYNPREDRYVDMIDAAQAETMGLAPKAPFFGFETVVGDTIHVRLPERFR